MKLVTRLAWSASLLTMVACEQKPPPPVTEVIVVPQAAAPLEPGDPAWQKAPEYVAKLLPQDLVEPRLVAPSTAELRVRAIAGGGQVSFRLEWADASVNDSAEAERFADACAVQVPAKAQPSVPAPQMGEPDKPVEITFWNAAWQAGINGRPDTIQARHPNATVDHYPFAAASLEPGSAPQREMELRYAPARAAGNPVAGPRDTPVQDLIATGPGTLAPAAPAGSKGKGSHNPAGWTVVITRKTPDGLADKSPGQVAFAVWQGAADETGARKMRTGWVPISRQNKP